MYLYIQDIYKHVSWLRQEVESSYVFSNSKLSIFPRLRARSRNGSGNLLMQLRRLEYLDASRHLRDRWQDLERKLGRSRVCGKVSGCQTSVKVVWSLLDVTLLWVGVKGSETTALRIEERGKSR